MEELFKKQKGNGSVPHRENEEIEPSEPLSDSNHPRNKKKKEEKEREIGELKKKLEEKEKEIDGLKKKLEEREKESKENYDRYLRTAADLENYKKRAAREKEDYLKFANEELIRTLLPSLDNLERAINHSKNPEGMNGLVQGIQLTIQQFLQALSKSGVAPIEATGKPFDPALHEAVMVVETEEWEPDHVIEEFQRGYRLNDRLLRPSTVSVSKPPKKEAS